MITTTRVKFEWPVVSTSPAQQQHKRTSDMTEVSNAAHQLQRIQKSRRTVATAVLQHGSLLVGGGTKVTQRLHNLVVHVVRPLLKAQVVQW